MTRNITKDLEREIERLTIEKRALQDLVTDQQVDIGYLKRELRSRHPSNSLPATFFDRQKRSFNELDSPKNRAEPSPVNPTTFEHIIEADHEEENEVASTRVPLPVVLNSSKSIRATPIKPTSPINKRRRIQSITSVAVTAPLNVPCDPVPLSPEPTISCHWSLYQWVMLNRTCKVMYIIM
ncbi:hypothetical protein BDF19DRAFT_86987 [Syncephalis fuscata]|nr:hypothetical protein BDF19DRAFT_86987 [Syncephalis fuscata]